MVMLERSFSRLNYGIYGPKTYLDSFDFSRLVDGSLLLDEPDLPLGMLRLLVTRELLRDWNLLRYSLYLLVN